MIENQHASDINAVHYEESSNSPSDSESNSDADSGSSGEPSESLMDRVMSQSHRADLLKQAREASSSPGVYLMKDGASAVIYVGKAKNLSNRLSQYFQSGPHDVARTELMVGRVNRFDVILTETEAEALILESTLIKKYKPKFNIRLKDDKTYPYLKIRIDEPFPRIEWTRKVVRDSARYFGPFPSAWSAREVLGLLNETFRLRDCSDNTFRHRSRPCILYQMGKCTAPCVGLIQASNYSDDIQKVMEVLEGKTESLTSQIRQAMEDAASREEFELAGVYRDQIRNLQLVTETQGVVEAGSQRDRDVVALARNGVDCHGTVLRIRGGKLVAVQHYLLQNTDLEQSNAALLSEFVSQYYGNLGENLGEDGTSPKELLLPEASVDLDWVERSMGVAVRVAENSVDEQLLNVARANAKYALEQGAKKVEGHGLEALEEIQSKLHLDRIPQRIECYDISNTQGEESVASRVVFIEGAPDKSLYRRYKIRTVEGANDFASMKEVLGRRFATRNDREMEELPDLVVVDGGKGQLAQAVAILEELQIQGVSVVGLAKARTESDFRSKEVKSSFERIFIPNRKNSIPLLPHSHAYKLLTHIRDEAHRFAITYHRQLRQKKSLRTEG